MALPRPKSFTRGPRGLMDRVVWLPIGALKEFPDNPRRHPESQIAGLMRSIRRFWTNPILIDETGTILAGHGRWEAARRLGMTEVPNDATVGVVKPNTGAAPSRSAGKQPRILKYLSEHFPNGVPEPGLYPRKTLQFEILEKDPGLRPLDEGTLKKAIEKYNASLK